MRDDFILGAQWTSYDNGMTWERVPAPRPAPRPAPVEPGTTMTVTGFNRARGEITVMVDFERVFGVRKPIIHALAPDNRGGIKAKAACGEVVIGPHGPGPTALPFEQRAHATCHICRAS